MAERETVGPSERGAATRYGPSVVVAAIMTAQPLQAQQPVVGVIRADGLLLPFVEWVDTAFQLVDQERSVRDRWGDEWYSIDIDANRDTVRSTNIVHVMDDGMGYDWWGLLTDYSRPIQKISRPIERVAVATSAPLLTAPVRDIAEREAARVAWHLREIADSLSGAPPDWLSDGSYRENRDSSMVVHGHAVRIPSDDAEWVAFEARQMFWQNRQTQCRYGAVLTGWARLGSDVPEFTELRSEIGSSCGGRGPVERPLALFEWRGTYYVVVNVYGNESEAPILRAWRDGRFVVEVAGS